MTRFAPMLPRIVLGTLLAVAIASCGDDASEDSAAPSGGEKTTFELTGRWRGQLEQQGLAPFTVTATIRSLDGEAPNTVSYSEIDCSGTWRYLGRRKGSFRFHEVIDRGRGEVCKGAGTVTLTPADSDRLGYVFEGGGVESRGVLSRVGSSPG